MATEFAKAASAPRPRAVLSAALASLLAPSAVVFNSDAVASSPIAVASAKVAVMFCRGSTPPIPFASGTSVDVKPAFAPSPIAVLPTPRA